MLDPTTRSTGTWSSSSTFRTPISAQPRAPPPERTSPIFGRTGSVARDAAGTRSVERRGITRRFRIHVGPPPGCIFTPMPSPRYPSLFQVNTRVRLTELARTLGRRTTLDDVPDADLEGFATDGFDLVWFLGVWQTGEAGRRIARTKPDLVEEYRRVLPGYTDADVPGSCFAVPRVPGPRGLRRRRGARAPAREAPPARPAADPRLRPEPRRAGPSVGRRAPGVLRSRDRGAARGGAAELGPHAAGHPRVRPRPVLRRLDGHRFS